MRKLVLFISALFLCGAAFISCHRAGSAGSAREEKKINLKDFDSSNWISSFDAGKLFSAKNGKKIILFFSDDKDESSAKMKKDFIEREDFVKSLVSEFVLVNVALSEERFAEAEKAEVIIYDTPDAPEDEKAKAISFVNALLDDINLARIYNVGQTPAFYIVSADGLVVDVLPVSAGTDEAKFNELLSNARQKIAKFDEDMTAIKKSKGLDKINAINDFFDSTPVDYRYFLTGLCQLLVDTDKKNESGLVGKHLVVIANNKAVDYFLNQNPGAASDEFISVAENPLLSPDERQQTYYTAGYLLAQSGSIQYGKIKDCFQKAYDADPSSEYAPKILEMVQLAADREAEFDKMMKEQMVEPPSNQDQPVLPETESTK